VAVVVEEHQRYPALGVVVAVVNRLASCPAVVVVEVVIAAFPVSLACRASYGRMLILLLEMVGNTNNATTTTTTTTSTFLSTYCWNWRSKNDPCRC